jgi:hypothetical protein
MLRYQDKPVAQKMQEMLDRAGSLPTKLFSNVLDVIAPHIGIESTLGSIVTRYQITNNPTGCRSINLMFGDYWQAYETEKGPRAAFLALTQVKNRFARQIHINWDVKQKRFQLVPSLFSDTATNCVACLQDGSEKFRSDAYGFASFLKETIEDVVPVTPDYLEKMTSILSFYLGAEDMLGVVAHAYLRAGESTDREAYGALFRQTSANYVRAGEAQPVANAVAELRAQYGDYLDFDGEQIRPRNAAGAGWVNVCRQ